MANHRNRFPARRRFLKQSTALTATMMALPHFAGAKPANEAARDSHTDAQGEQDNAATAPPPPTRHVPRRRLREPKP